jgi:transposase
MAECDQRLQQYLLSSKRTETRGSVCRKKSGRNGSGRERKGILHSFDLRAELFRMTGTDLTQIDGIDVTTTMTILSEAGWDMSKWKTEHHFVSWLRLCPDNRISGGKIIGKGRLPTNNRVTNALRMAASTLRLSNTYLGAQFRRLRTKLGAPVAIKAMAAKLARLVYRMLRYGMHFIDRGAEFYETQHRKLQINYLKRKAANLGFQIIEAPAA